MDKCPKCGEVAVKLVPAGISKKNNKPYKAFYACTTPGCDYRANAEQTHTANAGNTQQVSTQQLAKMLFDLKEDITPKIHDIWEYVEANKARMPKPKLEPKREVVEEFEFPN